MTHRYPIADRNPSKSTLVVVLGITMFLLLACGFLERRAPQRDFALEALLVDDDIVSPAWKSSGSFYPAGDELVTRESIAKQFAIADLDPPVQASQDVYRYRTIGTAEREFERIYLPYPQEHHYPIDEWTYRSTIADASHFGCYDSNRARATMGCAWAGLYEEYIVVFGTFIVPGEMSVADMERVVETIDALMAQYLNK